MGAGGASGVGAGGAEEEGVEVSGGALRVPEKVIMGSSAFCSSS